MKIEVEMEGEKGRVYFEMELDPENVTFDGMLLIFDKALEAYRTILSEEREKETERRMA